MHAQWLFALILSLGFISDSVANENAFHVPSRAKRIYALEKAGLLKEAEGMDELDQDIFYLRAHQLTQEQFEAKYPGIKQNKLKALQAIVKEEK